jgi:hypothetical protein
VTKGWLRLGVAVAVVALSGCGASGAGECADISSVSGFVINLSIGIDNRAEDQFGQFRNDTLRAHDLVLAVAEGGFDAPPDTMESAAVLAADLGSFIDGMDGVLWDVTQAALDASTYSAWEAASSREALARANMVEAAVIDRCGLPEVVTPEGDGPAVLPFPSVPSPTATDPPTAPIDEDSEALAMGRVLAEIYLLELEADQLLCLGRQMQNFENMVRPDYDDERFLTQFRRAFSNCDIDFVPPEE